MRGLAIVAVVAAVVALLWFATLRASGVVCEACMEEAGRSSCRSARAATIVITSSPVAACASDMSDALQEAGHVIRAAHVPVDPGQEAVAIP